MHMYIYISVQDPPKLFHPGDLGNASKFWKMAKDEFNKFKEDLLCLTL